MGKKRKGLSRELVSEEGEGKGKEWFCSCGGGGKGLHSFREKEKREGNEISEDQGGFVLPTGTWSAKGKGTGGTRSVQGKGKGRGGRTGRRWCEKSCG